MARQIPDLTPHLEPLAEPGEQLLSATWAFVRPPLAKVGYAMGWIGINTFGKQAANRAAKETGAASKVPLHGTMVMGLTDRRLVVWEGNMTFGHVNDLVGSIPRSRIRGMKSIIDSRTLTLELELTDAPSVTVRTPADAEDFVSAWRG